MRYKSITEPPPPPRKTILRWQNYVEFREVPIAVGEGRFEIQPATRGEIVPSLCEGACQKERSMYSPEYTRFHMPEMKAKTRRALPKARPFHRSAHLPPGHTHPEHSRPSETFLFYYTTKTNRLSRVSEDFNIKIFKAPLPCWLRPENTKQPLSSRRLVVQ